MSDEYEVEDVEWDAPGTEDDIGYCLEEDVDDSRGVFETGKKWENGKELRIRFLNGTTSHQNLVKKYAVQWTDIANLRFKFVGRGETAEIRIQFGHSGDRRNSSFIAKDALNIHSSSPTMRLYLDSNEEMSRRRILHEFGHAIGLKHEHQNPDINIPWNPQGVYEAYGVSPRNSETQNEEIRARVNHNVLTPAPRNRVDNTAFDKESVMLYPIPRSWVKDASHVRGWNTTISATDHVLITKYYPRT